MRSAKFIRVLAVCGIAAVGVGASAEGATIQAGGCSQSQVVSAINSAKDGDTVVVPAGNCTWTSTVTIDGKSITLQGAGIDATVITDGIDSGGGAKPVLLSWITKNTGLSRLTGFTFNGGSTGGKSWTTIVAFYGSTASLRIDHNKIIPTRVKGMEVSGYLRGVIDHNYWQLDRGWFSQGLEIHHPNWGDVGDFGDNSWAQPTNFGSSQFMFVEDNQFVSSGGHVYATDGWMGQRVVYRRNTFTNSTWANHGTETSGRWRSARASEVYQNTFVVNTDGGSDWSLGAFPSAIGSRGGTSIVFDNNTQHSGGGSFQTVFDLQYYRSWDFSRPYPTWDYCNGSNSWDNNSAGRCIDQPGNGQGGYMSGYDATPHAWPNQSIEPVYIFNNLRIGSLAAGWSNANARNIVANRDYYNQDPNFNGSSGMGRGPLSSRPSSCTAGVAYWATDQGEWDAGHSGPDGQLYKCVSNNSWSLYYTPYVYPHPLVSGGSAPVSTPAPQPPSNVRLIK